MTTSLLDRALELHPQVALRPEPFGALAYHYGNRRLVFLKHPDMVAVARHLGEHATLAAALKRCAVDRGSLAVVRHRVRVADRVARRRRHSRVTRERLRHSSSSSRADSTRRSA